MLIKTASNYLGEHEKGSTILSLMQYYNDNCYGLVDRNRRYKIQPNDSWCAMFASVVALKAGVNPDIFPYEVSVYYQYLKAVERGVFSTNSDVVRRNDLILFSFKRGFDHVGIVESNENGFIKTIEGNKGDKVDNRLIQKKSPLISGFILLNV